MTTLLEAIKEEGFSLVKGVACTYSANETTLKELEKALGVSYDHEKLQAFREGKSFRLYVQQGEWSGAPSNAVRCISHKKGVLHAKVYCLKLCNIQGDIIRYKIVVTSANLTNSDELNVYASFISKDGTKLGNGFGTDFSDFFKKNFGKEENEFDDLLSEIRSTRFDADGEKATFLDVDPKTLDQIENDGICTIVSPFLSKEILKKFLNAEIISRKDQLDAVQSNGKILCTSDTLTDTLHAKIYICRLWVYLGSANATNSAFNQNIEALVRFPKSNVGYQSDLDDWTQEYKYDPNQSTADANQKAFDSECRKIVAGFGYDNYYKFDYIPQEYTVVFLDSGVSAKQPIKRNDLYIHNAELTIKATLDGTEYKKHYTLLIDGKPLQVDKKMLQHECETLIIRTVVDGRDSPSGSSVQKNKGTSFGAVRQLPPMTLVDSLRSVRTLKELKTVRENAEKFLTEHKSQVLEEFLEQTTGLCQTTEDIKND